MIKTDEEIADTALNYRPPVTLSKAEAEVVRALLKLYETLSSENLHGSSCECLVCEAEERCGNLAAATFESLEGKLYA